MGYNPLINGVYWGYNLFTNLLLTSWDIQVDLPFLLRGKFQIQKKPLVFGGSKLKNDGFVE